MYQQHFGLARALTGDGIAQNESIFRTRSTERLFGELAVALNRKDSVAVLFGPSGTGKSTIAHAVLKELSTCLAISTINLRPLTPQELLEQILSDVGYEVFGKSHVELRQIWRQFICEAAATDTRVCLLIEDAESLDSDVLKSLHQLTAKDALMSPGCNVILTTSCNPAGFLATPELAAFSQRVRLRRQIDPLTCDELADFIEFKCSLADVKHDDLFTGDVAKELYEHSAGIIRVIDNLLESALALAESNEESTVTADCIAQVADTQFGLRLLDPSAVDQMLQADCAELPKTVVTPANIPTLIETVPAGPGTNDSPEPQSELLLRLRQY